MYRQGLKDNVKTELMRSGASMQTLDELYKETVRLDGELYELARELRQDRNLKPNYGKSASNYTRPKYVAPVKTNKQYSDPYGLQPMQLDNLSKGNKRKSGENKPRGPWKSQDKETRTCYTCGKPGHISRNCRSKNQVSRQINIVSIYAYSGVVRFITDYLIGGYIFTLFDRFYQSTNFFLNLLLYMLTCNPISTLVLTPASRSEAT
jgi:hypothetical protein